jgi:MAP/microtubule affinity-regulating kinase
MNNQSKNLAHFTSLSKKPLSSNLNFKYPTSLPSPKDSSNKIISNLNSFNSNGEIIMIKKKFLNKSKETESKSSYINFASPLSKYYKSNLKKKEIINTTKLILTSNDASDSNDKILSYLNNEKIKNDLISKSISVNKNDNLFNKVNKHKTTTNSSKNLFEQRKTIEGKKDFHFIHYPKNSSMQHSNHNNLKKYHFTSSQKQFSDNNSITNSKKNFFSSNFSLYNKNFLNKYLKNNTLKKKNANQIKKTLNINSIDFSYNNKTIKDKKLSTTTRQSPRKSIANINSLSSRINKIFSHKNNIAQSNKIFSKKVKSNSCDNNNKNNNNYKNEKNKKLLVNKFKKFDNYENSVEKNIEYNLHNINKKISKIVSKSQKEINEIKKNIMKHFTSNNSPNKDNYFSSDDTKKKELKKKGKSTESKLNKNKINNLKKSINVKKENIKYKSSTIKAQSQKKKKEIKITKEKDKKKEIKTSKKELEIKKQNEKQKINPKNLEKSKKEKEKEEEKETINLNLKIYKKEIKEIKKTPYRQSNLTNNERISNSTQSTSIHDSNYFLSESIKLSNFIKSYYSKSKTYPNTTLSFYKYGRLIGQGAFGKVNLGLNILTGRIVAIKSFNKQTLNKNNENKKKILYEIDLMKKLNHSNITKILENFETEKYILIIMEYINGGNLFSFVKKRRKLSEKTAKFLFKQIIQGIKYIHSKNIVHRDIKLENILIDLKNNIKICDFGISKILNDKNQKLYDQCGTPMYMAPEILLSTKEKCYEAFPIDLWSSGICLYIMLNGTLPFSTNDNFDNDDSIDFNKKNTMTLRYNIIHNNPKIIENISNEAIDLLNGLLNKNPKLRFTVDDVLNHPWLKNDNYSNFKYHLFTKAEIIMLNKTYIDYRFAKLEDIKENFTVSNLNNDELNTNFQNNPNCTTKSYILAPFSTIKNFFPNDNSDEEIDDPDKIDIKLENNIILFANKIKEYNMNYELNNNGELDNGMIINSKTESNSITSVINNSINLNEKSGFYYEDDENDNNKSKNVDLNQIKIEEDEKKEKILNKIEEFGYDKNYVIEKLNENDICHVTAIYYLMMYYENI